MSDPTPPPPPPPKDTAETVTAGGTPPAPSLLTWYNRLMAKTTKTGTDMQDLTEMDLVREEAYGDGFMDGRDSAVEIRELSFDECREHGFDGTGRGSKVVMATLEDGRRIVGVDIGKDE